MSACQALESLPPSASFSLSLSLSRYVYVCVVAGNISIPKTASVIAKFQRSATTVQAIVRLSRGDSRTAAYFSRCVYYQIMIPYGTQSGSPLTPSTSEHIEGHPYWQNSASSYRTIAIPMSPVRPCDTCLLC